jgi:hypothetical protein
MEKGAYIMEPQDNTPDHILYMTTDSGTVASSFLFSHHLSSLSLFFFFPKTLMGLKSLQKVPLGPFTIDAFITPFRVMPKC